MQGSTLQFNGVDQVEWFLAGESFVPTFLGGLLMLLIVTLVIGTFYFWKFEARPSQHKYKNEELDPECGLESHSWQAMQTMDRAALQFQELRQRGHISTDNHAIGTVHATTPLYPPGYNHTIVRPPPINITSASVAPFYAFQPHSTTTTSSSLYQQSNNGIATSDLLPRPTTFGGPKQRKKSDSISRLSPTAGTCGSRSTSRDSADGGMTMMKASLIVSANKDFLGHINHTAFVPRLPTQESIYGNYFDHHHNSIIANHPPQHNVALGADSIQQYLSPLPPVPSPQQFVHHQHRSSGIPISIQPHKIIRDFLLESEHTDVLESGLSVPHCSITDPVTQSPISRDEQQIIRPSTDTLMNGIRASKPLFRLRERGFSPHSMMLSSDDDGERSERDSHSDMVESMMHKITAPAQQNNNNLNNHSDSSSHLLRLDLKDLSLDHVLGGGAFGQVWAGTWRGTPVRTYSRSVPTLPCNPVLFYRSNVNNHLTVNNIFTRCFSLPHVVHPFLCMYVFPPLTDGIASLFIN